MLRWFRSLFAWRRVMSAGVWGYWENAVTGQRKAERELSGGYSPVDFDWLDAGVGHPKINGIPAWRTAQGRMHDPYFR